MFGLRHIKSNKIISFYSLENDKRDFCISKSIYLSLEDNHEVWSVEDRETAENVRQTPRIAWNRASMQNPSHNFDPDELQVIQFITL